MGMRERHAFLTLAAACVAVLVLALPVEAAPKDAVGNYIVVLKPSVPSAATVAKDHGLHLGAHVRLVYEKALKGYAASIPASRLAAIRADQRVAYVEPDAKVSAVGKPVPAPAPQVLPWGVDYVGADTSSTLAGNGSGGVGGVNAYVIDTGIDSHSDLNVVGSVNFAGGRPTDCNGHGTHVAGTIGALDNTADVVGVAPGVALTAVKVLDCTGNGLVSDAIAGVDWVTANARKPAVANMSLSAPASQALDDAVRRSAASGIVYSVAAGNNGTDACSSSPARAGAGVANGIITTAAFDSSGTEASWSNYGPCVDLWAPGVNILSTKLGGGTTTMSGTSMASPHVDGAAALYLASHPGASASTVEAQLKADARSTGRTSKDGRSIFSVYAGLY
jgi:subtilisin family serine protease